MQSTCRAQSEAQQAVQMEPELTRGGEDIGRYERGPDAGAGEMQLLTTRTGRWWVPDVQSLRLRLCLSAHAGDGAHFGLYKVSNGQEVTSPQASVSYTIDSITDERMVVWVNFGGGVWRFTYVAVP